MNNRTTIVYEYNNGLYLNITNRCPNLCSFCIKLKWGMKYRGHDLTLKKEPSLEDIIKEVGSMFAKKSYNEIVFCGYGEPLMRWDVVKEVASCIKSGKGINVPKDIKIRINTNGFGNIINKRDITPEMKGIIDSLSISLNTVDKEKWYEIMRPLDEYKEGAFESVIEFIKNSKMWVKEVIVTAVDIRGVNTKDVEDFAHKIGVGFRLRPYLEDYEEA